MGPKKRRCGGVIRCKQRRGGRRRRKEINIRSVDVHYYMAFISYNKTKCSSCFRIIPIVASNNPYGVDFSSWHRMALYRIILISSVGLPYVLVQAKVIVCLKVDETHRQQCIPTTSWIIKLPRFFPRVYYHSVYLTINTRLLISPNLNSNPQQSFQGPAIWGCRS